MPTGAYWIGRLQISSSTVHSAVTGNGSRVGVQWGLVQHVFHRRCSGRHCMPGSVTRLWFFRPAGKRCSTGYPIIWPAWGNAAGSVASTAAAVAITGWILNNWPPPMTKFPVFYNFLCLNNHCTNVKKKKERFLLIDYFDFYSKSAKKFKKIAYWAKQIYHRGSII